MFGLYNAIQEIIKYAGVSVLKEIDFRILGCIYLCLCVSSITTSSGKNYGISTDRGCSLSLSTSK